MQKFLLNVLALLTLAFIAPVQSVGEIYRVDIDNAANVTFDIKDVVVTDVHDGLNKIDMGDYQWLRVIANKDVVFTEVTKIDTWDNSEANLLEKQGLYTLPDGREYIDIHIGIPEDEYIRIRTKAASEARSASFTVDIDNPAKASLLMKGAPVTLKAGENTIEFDPATESKIEIEPEEYTSIYSLTLNGTEVTRSRYNYDLTVADDDKIVITTVYPDVDCAVKFTLVGDDVADFIREVDVNGRPELNWNKEGFSVKCGSTLTMRGRTDEYEVLQFLVNEKAETFSAETQLFITEETEIYISVQKYSTFKVTVKVNDPAQLSVYRGYVNNRDQVELTDGDNLIDIRRDYPFITVQPADGYYIDVIKVTDQPDYEPDELKLTPVKVGGLTANNVIDITTAKIVRDLTAVIFVNNLAAAPEGDFAATRADGSSIELTDGYTLLPFYDRDNDFTFTNPATVPTKIYLNDVALEAEGYNFVAALADGDAVKIFFDSTPATYTVNVTLDNVTADDVDMTRDLIQTIAPETFTALAQTAVAVAPKEGTQIEVSLDNQALTAAADGTFAFTVDADKQLTISAPESAITEIAADGATKAYDLQGRRVAPSTRGLIIVNGKKVIK